MRRARSPSTRWLRTRSPFSRRWSLALPTWSGAVTARPSRCWLRCAVPTSPAASCWSPACSTATAGPPGVLDAGESPPDFMADLYGEVSPDGREHFPVVAAKLARMHADGPMLTVSDLGAVASRTLVMVGDDEVTLEHAITLYRGLPEAELAVVPGTSRGLLVESQACATP
jgi:hypothetical protein